ncbi:MAG: protoporphyrinogen oxidase [Gemmatimonadales bacterium]
MARLVVVGAGISGLAAAWSAHETAARAGVTLDVLVLERNGEVGGKARTIVRDGWMVEGGPSGFLGGRPELDALLRASGLADQVLPANAAAKRRFLFRAGRMRELRASPAAFAASGILSAGGLLRLAAEPFIPPSRDDDDESVWAFAARRLGVEAADRLISPMTLGVFAGDARRLSLASAFPKRAALERDHGSLLRGMVVRRRDARVARRDATETALTTAGHLASLRDGMQSLPRRLARCGTLTVRCRARVRAIARTPRGWSVAVDGDGTPVDADALIIAAEPFAAAPLLRPLSAEAADALDAIPCPPVTVVALGFDAAASRRIPDGFGVLVSRGEGLRMLGNLWETSTYPGRGPAGGVLVRALFGGGVDPAIGELDDATMLKLANREVAGLFGLTAAPAFQEVVRIARAIPQYEIGHATRIAAVERAAAAMPGLAVTGFGLRGVAFADAAADGVRTGEMMGRRLTRNGASA